MYNVRSGNGLYQPNTLERWGDTIIQASIVLWQISIYTSPIIAYTAYRRGYFYSDSRLLLLKLGILGVLALSAAFLVRAMGRATNPTYLYFNKRLRYIVQNYNAETKKELQNYEFDYSAWPVDFVWKSCDKSGNEKTSRCPIMCGDSTLRKALTNPISLLGYVAIHTFAIKLIYPGSISVLNYIIKPNLDVGRKKLLEDRQAERFKLATPDGNELDAMFLDQRGKTSNGSTLVICTEGNAGFYEIGIVVTPIELEYSVLGWNHPGFGCSSGTPYINAEKCAIETVLQFAITRLNFSPENIILFGWSIGGFTSSYAATIYPDLKAVILDATFDDILPLALNQMPKFVEPIVSVAIRDHANLDVASYLIQYNGPISLIRRSEDEIISLTEGDLTTNRGNHLLVKLLKARYPHLWTDETETVIWTWFGVSAHKKDLIYEKYGVNLDVCKKEYELHKNKHNRQYPLTFGKDFSSTEKIHMLLYLASIYMNDYPSTHCTPLPSSMFQSFVQM